MKAVALLAHPDDCVIFARPFIHAHKEWSWTLVYLTYTASDPRAVEITNYWQEQNIPCVFLGVKDDHTDLLEDKLSFDIEQAKQLLISHSESAELILTHNFRGEYGHIHHRFVNTVADTINKPKVYFGDEDYYNVEYQVDALLDLNSLPLHRSVIEQFTNINHGRYWATDSAKESYGQLA